VTTGAGAGHEITGAGAGHEITGAGAGHEITGHGAGHETTGHGAGHETTGHGAGHETTGHGAGQATGHGAWQHGPNLLNPTSRHHRRCLASALESNPASPMIIGANASRMNNLALFLIVFLH
jgi:hypothetical protein